jgi:hypothetical protein
MNIVNVVTVVTLLVVALYVVGRVSNARPCEHNTRTGG